jgi:hypothetical protein
MRRGAWSSLIAATAISVVGIGAARAELVVIEQTGTPYKASQHFGDEATLDVPKGAHLKLKRQPDGNDVDVVGPYQGPLAKYQVQTCHWWNLLSCGSKDGSEAGGTRDVSGGTRGIRQ